MTADSYFKKMSKRSENISPEIEKHYTPLKMVKYCLSFLDLKECSVLDVGSGENMIWYNNLECKEKDWVEILKGKDLFEYNRRIDWCIGNPPYRKMWRYVKKSFDISDKGVAFLIAIDGINALTPKRMEELKELGFYLNKIIIMNCSKWFGRYFFVIFTKDKSSFINWNLNTFKDELLKEKQFSSIIN